MQTIADNNEQIVFFFLISSFDFIEELLLLLKRIKHLKLSVKCKHATPLTSRFIKKKKEE